MAASVPPLSPSHDPCRVVIIGAGECAARAVSSLREQGFSGTVTMLGNEDTLPYERPPLSKGALMVDSPPKPTIAMSDARLNELGVDFEANDAAVSVDRDRRVVHTASGQAHPYDRLLFATGARSRELPLSDTDGVFTLRTLADTVRLQSALSKGSSVAIIGGGFIGLEVAASVRTIGAKVTVMELGQHVMARAVPTSVAALVENRHRAEGVDLRLEVGVEAISRTKNGGYQLTLTDSSQVVADVVVAGIGAIPETALAAACGLSVDNGIVADQYLRTSDAAIFAAGDCVNFPHPLYDNRRVRLETWQTAHDHGALVGINMLHGLGSETSQQVADTVPWFWSDQYDLTLQVTGLAIGTKTCVRIRPDGVAIEFNLDGQGRLLAASAVATGSSVAKDIRLAKMLIAQRAHPSVDSLIDPAIGLKSLLGTPASSAS
jgi:3-phenylpropionate/trans-cinnamate dioxygenase ferredoxin reductase component